MVWSTKGLDNDFVKYEKIYIHDIPCLLFRPKNQVKALPTIIYYHGWQSSKENQRFNATILALFGYQVVVPDTIYHGERNPIEYNKAGMLEKYFWKIILQTVEESEKIINYILEYLNVDSNRIGIMGSSMGGFIASGIMTSNENIKSAVIYNGSCAWVKAEELYRKIEGREPITLEEKSLLHKYEPLYNKEKLKARPILMLHGDSDTSVPIDSQRIFYNEVSLLYKEKEDYLQLIELPNMNHYISTGMLEMGVHWCKNFL